MCVLEMYKKYLQAREIIRICCNSFPHDLSALKRVRAHIHNSSVLKVVRAPSRHWEHHDQTPKSNKNACTSRKSRKSIQNTARPQPSGRGGSGRGQEEAGKKEERQGAAREAFCFPLQAVPRRSCAGWQGWCRSRGLLPSCCSCLRCPGIPQSTPTQGVGGHEPEKQTAKECMTGNKKRINFLSLPSTRHESSMHTWRRSGEQASCTHWYLTLIKCKRGRKMKLE